MEELNLTYFILMGLAIWRLSSLLMKERGPFDLFVRVRKLIGVKHYDDGTPLSYKDNFFGNLFSCCWCLSVWIAFAYTAFYIFLPRYAIIFALPLSLSTVTILIEEKL